MYKTRPVGKNALYAENINSALVPALMRAHFADFLANSPATITKNAPATTDERILGEYTPDAREINLRPIGVNTMNLERTPQGDYVGADTHGSSTADNLNALMTAMHESYHSRIHPSLSKLETVAPMLNFFQRDPSKDLRSTLGNDQYNALMAKIKKSTLPTVADPALSDSGRMNELLATVIPAQLMRDKNMQTKETKRYLSEYDRLAKEYPALRTVVKTWEKPEQFR